MSLKLMKMIIKKKRRSRRMKTSQMRLYNLIGQLLDYCSWDLSSAQKIDSKGDVSKIREIRDSNWQLDIFRPNPQWNLHYVPFSL